MTVAVVVVDGAALQWFHWKNKQRPFTMRDDLRRCFLKEFHPTHAGTLQEQWLTVTQTRTVEQYRRMFIELTFPLEDIPESMMKGQFIMK